MVDRSGTVIVALPEKDDYVNRLSSEEVPHMTVLYLGDTNAEQQMQAALFLEHVANTTVSRFGLSVDRRGTLGPDEADVLFFDGKWSIDRLKDVRHQLLQDDAIRLAFNSAEQYPEWIPHLTMGYPETPAKEDDRDYPGTHWVNFDRLALWTGGFKGPEFRLKADEGMELAMSDGDLDKALVHFGVKGMKWGVRKDLVGVTSLGRENFGEVRVGSLSPKRPGEKELKDVVDATAAVRDKMLDRETGLLSPDGPLTKVAAKYSSKMPLKGKDLEDYDRDAHAVMEDFANKAAPKGAVAKVYLNGDRMLLFVGEAAEVAIMYDALAQSATGASQTELTVRRNSNGVIVSIEEKELAHRDVAIAQMKTDLEAGSIRVKDFLQHHGIKGMKWGIRRSDAQLARDPASQAAAGKAGDDKKADEDAFISADAERFVKTRQKAGHEMSDREIREALNRAKMVDEYNALFAPDANAQLKQKVDALELQVKYSELKAKTTPPSAAARVAKLIGSVGVNGFKAYQQLDKATDGAMTSHLKKELALGLKTARSGAKLARPVSTT